MQEEKAIPQSDLFFALSCIALDDVMLLHACDSYESQWMINRLFGIGSYQSVRVEWVSMSLFCSRRAAMPQQAKQTWRRRGIKNEPVAERVDRFWQDVKRRAAGQERAGA